VALAQRVQELNRYRSDFFGRLREILSDRENIRIVGDRFVFQSEVLFPPARQRPQRGRAGGDEASWPTRMLDLAEGNPAGDQLGAARRRAYRQRAAVGRRPLPRQLGALLARATSVVKFLIARGVPANRLVAAGFGEFQPLAEAATMRRGQPTAASN
jgi:chemotaxis protein MotB